jgi:hypothetical protein
MGNQNDSNNIPRENWEACFKEMAKNNDDRLLMDVFEDEDFSEWN